LYTGEVVVAGVRSPVVDRGGPSDEAVVFVHGNPGSAWDWEHLVGEVSAFARAIALDMPGFGTADKPGDFPYTVRGGAQHLGGALDALGVRRAHLVLHDFGGAWGLAWAASSPRRLASVTLINTGLLLGYRWHRIARIWRTPVLGELLMLAITRRAFVRALTSAKPRGLPRPFVERMYAHYDRHTRRAILRLYRATDPSRSAGTLAAALRAIDPPALVIWGQHDPYLPLALAFRQREVLPRAEVLVLEQSGHWPFIDAEAEVTEALVKFLRRHLGGAAPSAP
jgi:pimeloyl-ACP methyl ester carboxylesterase